MNSVMEPTPDSTLVYWVTEIQIFLKELWELLKDDFQKFKIFINEKKQYIYWIIISFISIQFVSIFTVGKNYDNYITKHCGGSLNQTGGDGEGPAQGPAAAAPAAAAPAAPAAAGTAAAGPAAAGTAGTAGPAKHKEGRLSKLSKRFKSGLNKMPGPVLGNLGIVTNAIMGAFSLILVLLAIAGIVSLPFLIFMILVYMILKVIANSFGML